MEDRAYYIQLRNQEGEIVEELIARVEDGDNIIVDRDGYILLIIRYID